MPTNQQILPPDDYIKCLRAIGNWRAEINRLRQLLVMKEDNLTIAQAFLNFPELIAEDIDSVHADKDG